MSKPLIINMRIGMGKTGLASSGEKRMMFVDQDDLGAFHDLMARCRQRVIDQVGDESKVLPLKEYISKSYDNLFVGKTFENVYEIKTFEGFVYFVNRERINPLINIDSQIERIHKDNLLSLAATA